MNRRHITVLCLAFMVLVVLASRAFKDRAEYVRGLEAYHVQELQRWVSTQRE